MIFIINVNISFVGLIVLSSIFQLCSRVECQGQEDVEPLQNAKDKLTLVLIAAVTKHWYTSVLNKRFLTPFRDGIWNRRQVSVGDRRSFPLDPETVGDMPS